MPRPCMLAVVLWLGLAGCAAGEPLEADHAVTVAPALASIVPGRLQAFKQARIRALVERFPQRRFVLVGDSGERDPEVYAAMLAEFPQRIEAVYIRNVPGEGQGAVRYQRLFGAQPGRLQVFADPGELPRQLSGASASRIPPIGR